MTATAAFSSDDSAGRLESDARLAAVAEEQVTLERLVTDIAAGFMGISADAVDGTVSSSLRRIVEALGLDGAFVWRKTAGLDRPPPTHSWVRTSSRSPRTAQPFVPVPWVTARLEAGEFACIGHLEELTDSIDQDAFRQWGWAATAVLPMPVDGATGDRLSAVAFTSSTARQWAPAVMELLRSAVSVIGQAIAAKEAIEDLRKVLAEVGRLRGRPRDEPAIHRRQATGPVAKSPLIASKSPVVQQAAAQVRLVAPTPATVLLLGETGSGKEVFAQAIHDLSPRHHRPMIKVNCAAIPSELIESELFGRERGAYTGALERQIGRFECAHESTLFLDEIAELPSAVQVKLLRVLQERVIERLGSTQPIRLNVRIIAATNRNLEAALEEKRFREDLYYRLNVFPVVVPPLRDRREDIPGLVWTFVDEFANSFGKSIESISSESMRALQSHSWPGNVRELRNVIERAVILATGRHLEIPLPKPSPCLSAGSNLLDLEAAHIRTVLDSTNWRVRGTGGAAQRLGLKPTTLESRMAKLGITRKIA